MNETLYKIDSKGKQREWSVTVNGDAFTTSAGLSGGKQTTKTTICKPKNVGRANEKTASDQALFEAEAKWIKKRDRELYVVKANLGKPPIYTPPMLALDATKVGHRIKWEDKVYVGQAKFNGVRCTTKHTANGIKLFSRKGKEYNVPHIQDQLLTLYNYVEDPGISFDGELYIHGVELGDVSSAVSGDAYQFKLEFQMFDLANSNMTFTERNKMLKNIDLSAYPKLQHVDLQIVKDMNDAKILHDKFVRLGYEGLILRDIDYEYQFGKKTPALFKYKEFQDAEFEIIDVVPDNDGSQAVLVYTTDKGVIFKARSKGSDAYREKQLANPRDFIGKMGTVRYSNLLASGAPEFPRGIHIRPDHE